MKHRRTYEVLVEDHGGELFVRTPAVAVVVGLPAVRERRTPHVLRHGSRVDLGGHFGQTTGKFIRLMRRPGTARKKGPGRLPDAYAQVAPRGEPVQRRMWPSPVTMYFVLVSSGRPIGPRACSFCVEMPIS